MILLVAMGACRAGADGAGADAAADTAPSGDTATACGDGELADGGVCVPEACGVGTWGELTTDDGTLFVVAGAPDGGDGTAAAPLASIQAAADLAASRGGGLVAVAAGAYPGALALGDEHDGVTLAGRCRELVTIDGSPGDDVPAVEILGVAGRPVVRLEGLTVTGGPHSGVWVQAAEAALHASDLRENVGVGIYVADASATLDDVGVLDTHPTSGRTYGRGINAQGGGVVVATGCTVSGNTEVGVYVSDPGTSLTLLDSIVADTAAPANGQGGSGIAVLGGATARVERSVVRGNAAGGVGAASDGTSVSVVDSEVVDNPGRGAVTAQYGARVELVRTTVSGNELVGVDGRDPGTVVVLDSSTVVDTRPDEEGRFGRGVEASGQATFLVTDSLIRANQGEGLYVVDAGTSAALIDTDVRDTLPGPDGDDGLGVWVEGGATLEIDGGAIVGNRSVGVFVNDPDTVATIEGARVAGTLRGRVTGLALGVLVQEDASARLTDLEIAQNEGVGLYVASGGSAETAGLRIAGNQFAGAVLQRGTLELDRATITGTLADEEWGGGFGVYASGQFGAGALTMTGSTVDAHPYAALWLDGDGAYRIERSALAGSAGFEVGGWPLHGNAVFAERGVTAWDGATGLLLVEDTFVDAAVAAVLLDASSATLDGNTWRGNAVDLWQQRCDATSLVPESDLAGVPTWEQCPTGSLLTDSTIRLTTLYLPEVDPL